jgi:hypothetical protein
MEAMGRDTANKFAGQIRQAIFDRITDLLVTE